MMSQSSEPSAFQFRRIPVLAAAGGLLTLLLAGLPGGPAAAAEAPARVTFFSPNGTVNKVRQARARFSEAMVALGDPRSPSPFDISCASTGKGRWVDPRNWVFDFDKDLPGGRICGFRLKTNLKSLDGSVVAGKNRFEFNTGGPAVRQTRPWRGSRSIDEEQIFILTLNAAYDPASLAGNAYCVIEGIGEQVPLRRITGDARAKILGRQRGRNRQMPREVVQCARPMPSGAKLRLVWGAGIQTPNGLSSSKDQIISYQVRPAFTANMGCFRVNAKAGCLPLKPIHLNFSAPVPITVARRAYLQTADGRRLEPAFRDGLKAQLAGSDETLTVSDLRFKPPFQAHGLMTLVLPAGLVDDGGRPLLNAARFPLSVRVGGYPPLAKFAATFGILEAREGGLLPVTVRNLNPAGAPSKTALKGRILRLTGNAVAISGWLSKVKKAEYVPGVWIKDPVTGIERYQGRTGIAPVLKDGDGSRPFKLPPVLARNDMQVIGIPLKEPGFYVVELASERLGASLLGRPQPYHVVTAALVTDMSVHFKAGRASSLVWVTRLSDGKPVPGAEIRIYDACTGKALWRGKTASDGTAPVAKSLGPVSSYQSCEDWAANPLLISAAVADDFSFSLSDWNEGIRPGNFNLRAGRAGGRQIAHTIFDRTLFRAGETVSMKHLLRRRTADGFAPVFDGSRRIEAEIRHQGSDKVYRKKIDVDATGSALQSWAIPKSASLGRYSVTLKVGAERFRSGRFQVQEFRLPTMRATVSGPGTALVKPKQIPLDLYVGYLSGGGAAKLNVKLRTLLEPRQVNFKDYADFTFNSGDIEAGSGPLNQGRRGRDQGQEGQGARAQTIPLRLDAAGARRFLLDQTAALKEPSRLRVEMDYPDANGEISTVAGRFDLWPSALQLGIRPEGWVATEQHLRFHVVALDARGRPQAGQKIEVTLFQRHIYSYRKRLTGGFYAYESMQEIKKIKAACSGETDRLGLIYCDLKPGLSGEVVIRAQSLDSAGNTSIATDSIWLVGKDSWWFGASAGDRMDLLPERAEYEAGETARFQVRMPFPKATALVTVEREGVIDHHVVELKGAKPVVEVPIKDHYAPNVFVSVLAVRGRVNAFAEWIADKARAGDLPYVSRDGGRATAMIDLSKPAYRLGMAKIRVGWKPNRLKVTVKTGKKAYRIRETAKVHVAVARANGGKLPAGAEIALAVVDEGLLELSQNRSWDLLSAMMRERGIEVFTSTAQTQVVGKRHYGLKAVPTGGGGGKQRARELFDTLLAWRGRVRLDGNGEATIKVPLNDSLTSFRVVAIAQAGMALFGTGDTSFKTRQDLILISGLPPTVREGDSYDALVTLRNTSARDMKVRVEAKVAQAGAAEVKTVELAAGAARDLSWRVTAPADLGTLDWRIEAAEVGGQAADRLKVKQKLTPLHRVRTYQAVLRQLDKTMAIPVERPKDAIAGRGGLSIALNASLTGGLDGVRAYMASYRFSCLEQQTSKAVVADDRVRWDLMMARLPAYSDPDGLLKFWPSSRLRGSDFLTAYVLSISAEAGWPIPAASRKRMIQALTRFVTGRLHRASPLAAADLSIRRLTAIEALSRHGAASQRMLDTIAVEPNLWPTSALLDWINILQRVKNIPRRLQRLRQAHEILRARLNFQGGRMTFATETTDQLWWLMVSGDLNAVRAVANLADDPAWREDIGRMMLGALGRMDKGHWGTTVANAWGSLAVRKFARIFEPAAPTGLTRVSYSDSHAEHRWRPDQAPYAGQMPWGDGPGQLRLDHDGAGKPWLMLRARAAIPLKEPLVSGFRLQRTVTGIEQARPGVWSRGDLVRVRLEMEAQSDMTWVAVEDPVPTGAAILGSGLGRDSGLSARRQDSQGRAWLAFTERRFDRYLAYYRYVPKGKWVLEYTLRLNNPGRFHLPPTRIEAMYAPEMYADYPNQTMTVVAGQ